ncbi:hypothetical protein MSAN_00308600 [Mycena sanguinolenta]|uniref:Uncharacterized protein n=1 Tax=Mycena sanguinolenta TaxID=230812 RepID=A0A8H6ZBB6_9AGAR|nr:hypothetical protein MSAN_00308600 [Mycena sanguinolenta]
MFRGPRQRKKEKPVKIFGGTGGSGGGGGVNGGGGGLGEGPRVKIITGGTVNKNYSAATVPSGFRTIPLGDIDLQREIQLERCSGVASLRRLYSAKIRREKSNRTIAVYDGDGAGQEWRHDIARYMAIRHVLLVHPNIVQLYGTASCGNMRGAVFNDDLIPLQQFLDLYQHSHFSTVYIYAYMVYMCYPHFLDIEFTAVTDYFLTMFELYLSDEDCTFFIRRSTGRFCVDLLPSGVTNINPFPSGSFNMSTEQGLKFLAGENPEATITQSLTLDQYHSVCHWDCSASRLIPVPPLAIVNISSVFNGASEHTLDNMGEIARLPSPSLRSPTNSWYTVGAWGEVMPNGKTRLNSDDATDTIASLLLWTDTHEDGIWLSQANHIFTALQISSNFQDYVVAQRIDFTVTISTVKGTTPPGFLFLCAPKRFRRGRSSFKWPDCPAYWSLDPSGAERLTLEDAINLGFPSFSFSMEIRGKSWDANVYAGLRQFHQAKGFDPDSQDVARYLGHPLYQLLSPFARIDAEYSDKIGVGEDTIQHSSGALEIVHESTQTDPGE